MKKERIDSIQILRALAFLEIFLGHCGMKYGSGSFGVSIFMILSGFCMAMNYLPKAEAAGGKMKFPSLTESVKSGIRKVKKLYPLHLIMLAITYVVVGMPTGSKAIRRLVTDIFLLKCWKFHSEDYYSYNGVAWYLSTYLFVCIMAPYVLYFIGKLKKKVQAIGSGVVVYAVMVAVGYYLSVVTIPLGDGFAKWVTYLCPFYRILDFSLGALLGWLYVSGEAFTSEKKGTWTMLEWVTFLAVIAFEIMYIDFKPNIFKDIP